MAEFAQGVSHPRPDRHSKRRAISVVRAVLILAACLAVAVNPAAQPPNAGDLNALHALLEANKGQSIHLPAGHYRMDRPLVITTDDTVLHGQAVIIQTNPDADILRIENAKGVRISGLTLKRETGRAESTASGIRAENCARLDIDGVRVIDNWSQAGTIHLDRCSSSSVRRSEVLNYKRIGVDDRTASELYGYAFRVIDGTGILVTHSDGIQIQDNRVIEERLYPTRETKERYQLGDFTDGSQPLKKGRLAPPGTYANNWHQGSAITVTSPESTRHVLISGNLIRNAAQGIDMHCDNVTCSNNVIDHAFLGIKCMHGSRCVIIANNTVTHMDLWGLVMLPGVLSHPAQSPDDDRPARGPNYTRGNIIANNIFSDFGFGHEYYNWEDSTGRVISLESGQLPENPVMTDVLVVGNIVYDAGADKLLVDGTPQTVPPRYKFAVYLDTNPPPQGIVFRNNILHPGSEGVSNVPIGE